MELPIRLEGGTYRVLAGAGECIAECPGGFPVASEMVHATNAHPYLIALLKRFIAGEAPAEEAAKFLAYLGEK